MGVLYTVASIVCCLKMASALSVSNISVDGNYRFSLTANSISGQTAWKTLGPGDSDYDSMETVGSSSKW